MRRPMMIVGLAAFWLLSGCDGSITSPDVGEPFTLAVGESVTLATTGTRIRFKEVSDDSRCPLRAECVWAGYGAIVLDVIAEGGEALEEALQTREGARSLPIGAYELTLLDLSPYPEIPGGIGPGEYSVRLVLRAAE